MTKYTVHTERFEFDPTAHATVEAAYFADMDHNDKIVAICDTIEEAQAVLATINVSTARYSRRLAAATVAFIAKGEYELEDDEWEYVGTCVDIYEFKADEVARDDD